MALGAFDETVTPEGWFDETASPDGWFDDDLASFGETVPEEFVKAGVATAVFTASGQGRVGGTDVLKTGAAVMGAAFTTTIVKTGVGVSARTGSGADASAFAETGSAAAVLVAAGVASSSKDKAGLAAAAFTAAGVDAETRQETGLAAAVFTSAGADANTSVNTGVAVAPFTVSGTKIYLGGQMYTKSGIVFMGAATVAFILKTGVAVSVRAASGADTTTFVEAADGLEFPEPPALDDPNGNPPQSARVASGAKTVTAGVTSLKTGTAVSAFTGTGAGVSTLAKTGVGILTLVGSGSKTVTTAAGTTFSKTGIVVQAHTGQGADAIVFVEAGGGGAATGTPYGSGAYGSGSFGISGGSDRVAFGARQLVRDETGLAVSSRVADGFSSITYVERGLAVTTMTVSGTKVFSPALVASKTGTAIIVFGARGVDIGSNRWLTPKDQDTIVLTTMVATTILLTPKVEDAH